MVAGRGGKDDTRLLGASQSAGGGVARASDDDGGSVSDFIGAVLDRGGRDDFDCDGPR